MSRHGRLTINDDMGLEDGVMPPEYSDESTWTTNN